MSVVDSQLVLPPLPHVTICPQLFFTAPHVRPAHVVLAGSGAQPQAFCVQDAPPSHPPARNRSAAVVEQLAASPGAEVWQRRAGHVVQRVVGSVMATVVPCVVLHRDIASRCVVARITGVRWGLAGMRRRARVGQRLTRGVIPRTCAQAAAKAAATPATTMYGGTHDERARVISEGSVQVEAATARAERRGHPDRRGRRLGLRPDQEDENPRGNGGAADCERHGRAVSCALPRSRAA